MMAGSIDLHQTASDLHCPVLVIHGSDDPIISVNAAHKSVQVVSRSELMILKVLATNSGRMPCDRPAHSHALQCSSVQIATAQCG